MGFLRQDPIQKEINDILKDLEKVINKRSSFPDNLKNIVPEIKDKLEKGGFPPSSVAAAIFPTSIQKSMGRIYVLALQSDKVNYRRSALIEVYWLALDKGVYVHADSTPALNGFQLLEEYRESVVNSLTTILQNDQLSTEQTLMCCITLAHLDYAEHKGTVVKLLSAIPKTDMNLVSYYLNACSLLKIPEGLPLAYSVADAFRKYPNGNGIGRIPFDKSMDLFVAILNNEVIAYLEKIIRDFCQEMKGKGQGIAIGQLTRLWVPHHGLEIIMKRLSSSQNNRIIQILAEFVRDAIPLEDEIVLKSKKLPDGSEERMSQYILGNNSIKGTAKRIVSSWNDHENSLGLSALGRVVTQDDLQSLMGKQFIIKNAPKPPETIEVPNVWGIGDGEPFVILRDPNIDDLFKTVSGADFKSTVTAYLGHPDRKVRIATLNQVIVRKTGAYNQSVVDRLADADAEVRMIAAKALWTDIKAVEFAIACLRDEARGYTSFGAPTFSTMKPERAVAGVDILRKTAPNSADLARFEEIYDELWNAEKREEEERAAFRAKQSKIEEIKKSLSSQELDELMSSMSDMERKFNIGDVLLNQKIEEKYLNKTESSLQTKVPLPQVSSQVSSPTEVKSTETSPVAKTSTKEIFCPYCNIYIIPDEVAGKRYCPNDGRELPASIEEPKAALSLSGAPAHTETVICPFCQTAIIPQEIAGKFYCPNDGKLLTLPSSTMREERNQPTSKTYCNNCGKEISTASPHSQICPYCGSSTS